MLLVWGLSSWLRCDVLLTGRGKARYKRCTMPKIGYNTWEYVEGDRDVGDFEDSRRESNHLALGDVLLNARLERSIAIVDGDFLAVRGSSCGVLCVRSHCRIDVLC